LIAVDTSIVVAAFATWHEAHERAVPVLAGGPILPAPVALEAYAVLTRLPPPHRAEPTIVSEFLRRSFRDIASLSQERIRRLVPDLVALGISGGASYDAVIAMIAMDASAELATLDVRARRTYELIGVVTRDLG
jgi:predicted nucleic acid-binding protein